MASRLNPYLSFQDTAREAMSFYQSVLGGELSMNTFGEYGDTGPAKDLIMHSQLETPAGYTLMGADTPPGMDFVAGSQVTISLSGDDTETLRGYFSGLAEGGSVTTPLEMQMWGDEFGQLVDKFGVGWLVNIAGQQA